ncbi:hypothetical protein BU17DRAFT_53155 [Hysterangium stoloniferum]|nr:hypothetical protein BU17DRAFT_53155 [Hysterangium stoloniferum]
MPYWKVSAITTGIPYWCLSIVFNVLVSMMICGHLLWHRHTVAKVLGKSHTTLYATLSAMFIESAALYVVVGIIHVVLFAGESSFHNLILGVMAQVEVNYFILEH